MSFSATLHVRMSFLYIFGRALSQKIQHNSNNVDNNKKNLYENRIKSFKWVDYVKIDLFMPFLVWILFCHNNSQFILSTVASRPFLPQQQKIIDRDGVKNWKKNEKNIDIFLLPLLLTLVFFYTFRWNKAYAHSYASCYIFSFNVRLCVVWLPGSRK